jgi:fructose 1,6-bisphosphate aldolase/phosphatase
MLTLSLFKADVGSVPGHNAVPNFLLDIAEESLEGKFLDHLVFSVGDDIQILLLHEKGENNEEVHKFVWDLFKKLAEAAKEEGFYGAGQDLLKDAFSGNLRGMGPGVAELSFNRRPSEPVVILAMDKTSPYAFNFPVYKIFADPSNTPGLVLSEMRFSIELMEAKTGKTRRFKLPEEFYHLTALITSPSYYVNAVYQGNEKVAVFSTTQLSKIAGRYVGKDDPAGIIRAHSRFPSVGEILEPFALPYLVPGWMRGSFIGPLMPMPVNSYATRFDGPPLVSALGTTIGKDGFTEIVDLFDTEAFDKTREKAQEIASYLRQHGLFYPHRLPDEHLEYHKGYENAKKLFD